jgi:hypothetical protein
VEFNERFEREARAVVARRHLQRHPVGGAILSFLGHKKFAVALCCLLPPFWRPAKMLFRALARWELADVSRVAFFEGFAKRLHIAVSSLSAL